MDPVSGFLLGVLVPSPSWGEVIGATRRQGRYSQALPSQVAHADAQTPATGLRRSITGLTGGEDWADEEASGFAPDASAGLTPLNRGLTQSVPRPTSWYVPNLPDSLIEGRGTGYVTDAYNKGWVALQAAGPTSWGASAGYGSSRPNVQVATLLFPTDATPSAAKVAQSYQDANAGHTRLSDMFGD